MAQPSQYQRPPHSYVSPQPTPSPMSPSASQPFSLPKGGQASPSTPTTPYQSLQSPPVANGAHPGYNPYAHQNPYPLPQQQPHLTPTQLHVRQTPPPPPINTAQPVQQQIPPQVQSAQPHGTMGPPSKPVDDRGPSLDNINDVLHGVVDVNAEYAYVGKPEFFDTRRGIERAAGSMGADAFEGAGNYGANPVSELQELEDLANAKERLAKKRRAERQQFHLNEPFLQQSVVLHKVSEAAQRNQTTIDTVGVFHPQGNTRNNLVIVGPEGQERLATLTKEPLLASSGSMGDILTLLSFAARERVRIAIEDSVAMARTRRQTSQGVVPTDFQDIAIGQGKAEKTTGHPVPIIGADSPGSKPRKRSHSQANELPTPVSDTEAGDKATPAPAPSSTLAYQEMVEKDLQRRIEEEEKIEQERTAKRARRATANLISSGEAGSRGGSVVGTPGPGTPGGPVDAVAPDQARLTKKEAKKKQEAEAATSAAIGTKTAVNMALGGGKKYGWMTGGKTGGGMSGTSFGRKSNAAKKADKPAAAAAAAATVAEAVPGAGAAISSAAATKPPKALGVFREDREDGTGIQVRDVVSAMRDYTKEKRTLARAFFRLNPKELRESKGR